MAGRSIVEYFAEHSGYRCGYCGNQTTSYSHGMWAHSMTVKDYQALIDRGWRRSGAYCYKPTMDQTCCPAYPIRCNALEFKLSKSQKKIIKRVNRFLNTGVKPGKHEIDHDDNPTGHTDNSDFVHPAAKFSESCSNDIKGNISQGKLIPKTETQKKSEIESQPNKSEPKKNDVLHSTSTVASKSVETVSSLRKTEETPKKSAVKPGVGADPTKPKCRKAKALRLERKLKKQGGDQQNLPKPKVDEAKTLEDYLNEVNEKPAHKLEIKTVVSSQASSEFERTLMESHAVYYKYQLSIHKDKPSKPVMSQYKSFLCTSPLKAEEEKASQEHRLGSFHQHYLLDGKLIAVGVIDILAHCTSSVYLYYDPEYHFLSLGNYSALKEIAFTRHLHSLVPAIKYYYMGFYIHSCPKMRYKGNYYPSFLVCPDTYKWVPVEEAGKKLDVNEYSRLAGPDAVDEDANINLDEVLVLHQRQAMPYEVYKIVSAEADDEEEVREYARFAGNTCATRMLLYRK